MSLPGPRLAVIGDVHTAWSRLERVLDHIEEHEADAILLVGDLACSGWKLRRTPSRKRDYRAEVERVLDTVRARGLPLRFVPGNHDLPGQSDPDNVDGRVDDELGLRIGGLGGAGPARFGFAYEWSERQAAKSLQGLGPVDLLLAHCPPVDTPLDLTASGKHVGSQAVSDFVAAHAQVMVCGHIHEAPGVHRLGGCLCLNAGGLGRPHGRARVGWVEGTSRVSWCDLEAGDGDPSWWSLLRTHKTAQLGSSVPWVQRQAEHTGRPPG